MRDTMDRLLSTTLLSHPITHSRLKHLASMAQTSEDHVSRLGMGLSMAMGPAQSDWTPRGLELEVHAIAATKEKQLRGKTLFKGELPMWMALVMRHHEPQSYDEWRGVMRAHWERGVEALMQKDIEQGDWLRTVASCMP